MATVRVNDVPRGEPKSLNRFVQPELQRQKNTRWHPLRQPQAPDAAGDLLRGNPAPNAN
jgi:hypothetical protein